MAVGCASPFVEALFACRYTSELLSTVPVVAIPFVQSQPTATAIEAHDRAASCREPKGLPRCLLKPSRCFRSIDTGNVGLNIPAYNGELFAHDAGLSDLKLTDAVSGR